MSAVHKSSYLTHIFLQTASFATEGILNVVQKKKGRATEGVFSKKWFFKY